MGDPGGLTGPLGGSGGGYAAHPPGYAPKIHKAVNSTRYPDTISPVWGLSAARMRSAARSGRHGYQRAPHQIVEALMGAEHAVRPAGCTCPWAQVHMEMPWQRLRTDASCVVHAAKTPPSQAEPLEPEWIG